MLNQQGKGRTVKENLRLAIVLSFVAGIVNVTGFLFLKELTTNVTGHFALFINDVANFNFWEGTIYFLYIFSFLFGSFASSFLIEKFKDNKRFNAYVIPVMIESVVLTFVAIIGTLYLASFPDLLACLLLFSMGLQNSYVTKVSDAVVRTTHLTGLFTDLGIELSYLFFKNKRNKIQKIKNSIRLRIYIISCFFLGGLFGGFAFSTLILELYTLLFAVLILLLSLLFKGYKNRLVQLQRNGYDIRTLYRKSRF